jgi:hypothetical protein
VKTVEEHLRKVTLLHLRDQDETLPFLVLVYIASNHKTTGTTPTSKVYGREPHLPCDLLFPAFPKKE